MITCPECGQAAPDDAKFCDRCGQGLTGAAAASAPPTRPIPLAAGTKLKGEFEIIDLSGQTSIENRYRAKRSRAGTIETVVLRERFAPEPKEEEEEPPQPEASLAPPPLAAVAEDPNGPRAKTAELKPQSR